MLSYRISIQKNLKRYVKSLCYNTISFIKYHEPTTTARRLSQLFLQARYLGLHQSWVGASVGLIEINEDNLPIRAYD